MNRDQVIDLLSVATAYDGRTRTDAVVTAWTESSDRARWTFDSALNAIHDHFAESTEPIKPGHVTQRIRAQRAEPPRSGALPQATPTPAGADHIRRVMAWMADRLDANRERHGPDARRRAAGVACPYCGAKPRKPCWQTFRGEPLASGKTMTEPHRERIRAAERESDE